MAPAGRRSPRRADSGGGCVCTRSASCSRNPSGVAFVVADRGVAAAWLMRTGGGPRRCLFDKYAAKPPSASNTDCGPAADAGDVEAACGGLPCASLTPNPPVGDWRIAPCTHAPTDRGDAPGDIVVCGDEWLVGSEVVGRGESIAEATDDRRRACAADPMGAACKSMV